MLDDALQWAARGFRVFPISPGDKVPPKGMRFKSEATTDPDKIRSWWAFTPGYNVGVATGDGLLVVDVDARKGGLASLLDLDLPDATLTVRTPSGGYHLYLSGPDVAQSVERLGPGIDIRSAGGYVVGPGSFFADPKGDKGYTGSYAVATDGVPATAPAGFVLRCGEPRERDAGPAVSVDDPSDIVFATHYLLKDAPVAVEGRGGNGTTYAVAARLIEIGVSAERAADLMLECWNERCDPPWSRDEIVRIAANAGTYAQARQGSGGVSAIAEQGGDAGDVIPAAPPPTSRGKFDAVFTYRPLTPIDALPNRPWIVNRLMMRHEAALLAGPGGVGKSGFTLALAAHGAMGMSFAGYGIPRPFKTIVYNLEDTRHEMEARLYATCDIYGFDPAHIERSILLWPGREMRFKLMDKKNEIVMGDVQEIARLTRDNGFDALILDPLVSLHSADENDNTAMQDVMDAANGLARLANVAVLGLHHTPKSSRHVGSSDAVRGAGNIVNSVRIVHTMFAADEDDNTRFALGEGYKAKYVRIDDAKLNVGPLETHPTWFEKISYPLPNGDTVQGMQNFVATATASGEAKLMAVILSEHMHREGAVRLDLHSAARVLSASESVFKEMVPMSMRLDSLRARVEMRFGSPITLDDGVIVRKEVRTEPGETSSKAYVTIEAE